jgi:hypothetical protein
MIPASPVRNIYVEAIMPLQCLNILSRRQTVTSLMSYPRDLMTMVLRQQCWCPSWLLSMSVSLFVSLSCPCLCSRSCLFPCPCQYISLCPCLCVSPFPHYYTVYVRIPLPVCVSVCVPVCVYVPVCFLVPGLEHGC